jgi:hypothetical protein
MSVTDLLARYPAQDYVTIANVPSPGRATILGAGLKRTWEIRKGYGLSGATVVFTGADLAKFDIEIALWDAEHWIQWDLFAKAILAKPPTALAPVALGIQHPLLNLEPLKITSIVVEEVTQFEEDDSGLWICKIKCIEYRAPMLALAKPKAAIPSAKVPKPTAQDAAEVEIQRLLGQFNALTAGGA